MLWIISLAFAGSLLPPEPCIQEILQNGTIDFGVHLKSGPSASDLSLEVNALQLLYDLQSTKDQLEKMRKWFPEAAKVKPRKDLEVSKEFREKLLQLHKALAQAVDGEQIEQFVRELEELRDKENPLLDDKVDITPFARKRTADLLRVLEPKQVAALLALDGDGIADPRQKLKEAVEDVRAMETEEWKAQREVIAGDIARLAAGIDAKKHEQVHDDVIVLLVKSRKLDLDDFQAERKDLEKEGQKLIGELGALDFVRNYVEYQLAELLSNPRLTNALELRLATDGKTKKGK